MARKQPGTYLLPTISSKHGTTKRVLNNAISTPAMTLTILAATELFTKKPIENKRNLVIRKFNQGCIKDIARGHHMYRIRTTSTVCVTIAAATVALIHADNFCICCKTPSWP
jgi:hypothetical protein